MRKAGGYAIFLGALVFAQLSTAKDHDLQPVVKATSFSDMEGEYYLAYGGFSFCDESLYVSAFGSSITGLLFDDTKTTCGTDSISVKTYPGGSSGTWAGAMGQRVQSNMPFFCDGERVHIMFTRAETDYSSGKPLYNTEDDPKYFSYIAGYRYLSFVRDFAGDDKNICLYSTTKLNSDGSLPGSGGGGISTGIKIVIGISIIVIALLVGLFAFLFFRRKISGELTEKDKVYEIPDPTSTI